MTVSRVEGHQVPPTWSYDPLAHGGIPSNEDAKKVAPPIYIPWQTDTIITHPDSKSTQEMMDRNDRAGAAYMPPHQMPNASAQQQYTGWNPNDSVTSAASTNSAPFWSRWLSGATNAASAIIEMLHPEKIMTGVTEMAQGLWTTLGYLRQAFGPDLSNPRVQTATIPEINPDGSRNPFGGRRITPDDYKHLLTMQNDVNQLLDILGDFETEAELEKFVIALMKALAQDKTEDLDHLRVQLSLKYRDRKIDSESVIELMKKIRANPTYDWFIEATTHTTMVVGGLALGAAGGWGLPLAAFGALGLFNQYANHWSEKTAASVTATASTWALGGDYKKTHEAHTGHFRTAHQTLMTLFSISVPFLVGTGSFQGLLNTFMSIPSIGQTAANLHRAIVKKR